MGTLWVRNFPSTTITLPCGGCNISLQSTTTISLPHTHRHFYVRASHSNNTTRTRTRTRKSRRLKSDAEICNDIRQFLTSVGLPEHHIPSTKELLHHGRNDLANIVRRRGHKQIKELLTSSLNADTEKSLDKRLDAGNDYEEGLLTGQNETVDSSVNDVTASTEFLQGNSSSSLLDECTSNPVESSANLSVEDGLGELKDHAEGISNVAEGNFYPTEGTIVDDDYSSSRERLYPYFYYQSSMPIEISGELPLQTTSSGNSEHEDSLGDKMVGEITLPSAVPSAENHSNTSFNDSDLDTGGQEFSHLEASTNLSLEQKDWYALEGPDDSNDNITEDNIDSSIQSAVETSHKLSLEEKVANFIQNGDLEPVEDDSQESKVYIESESVGDVPSGVHPPKDNNVTALNGNSLTSDKIVPPVALDQRLQDDHMPHEDLTTHFGEDLDAEDPKMQNQSEINHLKFMLYQKELELSRMKEQIEKEKLALSVLQTKAEAEISKARKLISEKDAELNDAEESLSGLKEVQIEFHGDADEVEVAGSFNGWHHRIKLDPQPSASVTDLGELRGSRIWSTMLWLYPGVYEIKFVVDGHWRTDPEMESVTRGHICNNILRVDR